MPTDTSPSGVTSLPGHRHRLPHRLGGRFRKGSGGRSDLGRRLSWLVGVGGRNASSEPTRVLRSWPNGSTGGPLLHATSCLGGRMAHHRGVSPCEVVAQFDLNQPYTMDFAHSAHIFPSEEGLFVEQGSNRWLLHHRFAFLCGSDTIGKGPCQSVFGLALGEGSQPSLGEFRIQSA